MSRRTFVAWFDGLSSLPRSYRIPLTILAPLTIATLFIFMCWVAITIDRALGFPPLLPKPIHIWLAIPFLVVGLLPMYWALWRFVRARGTPVPFTPPKEMVVSGPYRHVRHPMYAGALVAVFGCGLLANSFVLLIGGPIGVLLGSLLVITQIEEPQLIRRYGAAYEEYRKRVPMLVPGFRSVGNTERR